MRKILSLMLCLMMIISCIPAMAEEAAAVKTGLSFTTSLTSSKDGQSQANINITAVTVDENGVITQCIIDVIQGKVAFDATGVITTDMATEYKSKLELKDDYKMRSASSIKAEWFEQANAFAAYCVGKTAEQVQAAELNEKGVAVDVISSCTMPADEFISSVVDAVNKAEHRGAKAGDVLKLVQTSNMSSSKNATAEADGLTQVNAHVGMFTVNGDVITSAYIDAVQAKVNFSAEGKITSDLTTTVLTKNELKDGYNMRNASPIKKEWFEQTAAFCEFITGETLNKAVEIAANPAETDVIASCTIKVNDFLKLLVKAGL